MCRWARGRTGSRQLISLRRAGPRPPRVRFRVRGRGGLWLVAPTWWSRVSAQPRAPYGAHPPGDALTHPAYAKAPPAGGGVRMPRMRVRIGYRRMVAGATVVVALLAPIAAVAGGVKPSRAVTAPLCRTARDPRLTASAPACPMPPPAHPPRRLTAALGPAGTAPGQVCAFANARQYRPPQHRPRHRPPHGPRALRAPGPLRHRRRRRTGRLARLLARARRHGPTPRTPR